MRPDVSKKKSSSVGMAGCLKEAKKREKGAGALVDDGKE
jgi:hypothetical protein